METSKTQALSASKISVLDTCSWLYYCKYILKLPSKGNSGSLRGDLCHRVLECLNRDKHKKHFLELKKKGDFKKCIVLNRLIKIIANKNKINNEKDLELINKFLQTAVNIPDFLGPKGLKEKLIEKEFNFKVDTNNFKYNIRGFMDILYICEDKEGLYIKITDLKTTKAIFEGEKAESNIQSLMYELAAKLLFPDIKKRKLEFIFLAFPENPILKQPQVDDFALNGFQLYLTSLQEIIDDFDINDAKSNFAADKGWLPKGSEFGGLAACGYGKYPGHISAKTSKEYYVCEAKFPQIYYILKDKNNNIIKSASSIEELGELKQGEFIEEKKYLGCPKFSKDNY